MKLLVLGGTEFVGRALVNSGLERGWDVTVLNRGTKPAPTGAKALVGDRRTSDGLTALAGTEWDIVADAWSWAPTAVRDSAKYLSDKAGRYVYISTCSVHGYPVPPNHDESTATVDASPDDSDGEYAQMKRGAEIAVEQAFGDRALLMRPGLILGPHENIGRLPWWLQRIARGGDVLAPGPADLPLQYIDARDLSEFSLDAAAAGLHGAYNSVSATGHATMRELLEACVTITGSDARLRWLDPAPILEAGVEPWMQLPVWLPPGEGHDTMYGAMVDKALAAGMHCRPILDTVRDTWAWLGTLDGPPPQRTDRPPLGLDPQVEAALLAAN